MSLATLTSVLALSGLATAALPASLSALPLNSQVGKFAPNLTCSFLGQPFYLDGLFYALAPNVAAPGQKIYFSDSTTQVTIPQSLNSAAAALKATYALTKTYVNLDFTNASPASFAVFPNGLLINTTLHPESTTTVVVPAKGVLPSIGPITVGKSGVANFYFGLLVGEITLYNQTSKVFGPYNLTCTPPAQRPLLGLVNIAGSPTSAVAKPALGRELSLPAVATTKELGYYHTTLTCSIGSYKNVALDLFFGGLLAGSFPKGKAFSITSINSRVNVPQSFVNTIKSAYSATSATTTINAINLALSNASPSTKNILAKAFTNTQSVPSSGGLTLNIPASGAITAGPFTPTGAAGSYMTLQLTTTTGNLAVKNAAGKVTNLAISCAPAAASPFDLYSILISST